MTILTKKCILCRDDPVCQSCEWNLSQAKCADIRSRRDLQREAAQLEAERLELLQQLEELERRKRQIEIIAAPYTRRGDLPLGMAPDDYPPVTYTNDSIYDSAYAQLPAYDRRHSASSSTTHRSDRKWSMSQGTSIWTPVGPVTPNGQYDDQFADQPGGLHHARSSPELNYNFGKVRISADGWPEDQY